MTGARIGTVGEPRSSDAPAPVVTIGESLGVFDTAAVGALAHLKQATIGFGGAESNVAIGLRRLGVPVTWMGRVGADAVGDLIVRELTAEGVGLAVVRDADAPTSVLLKTHRMPGTTEVLYYRKGNAGGRLTTADLDLDAVRRASLLHVTGISLALSTSMRDAIHTAVATARDAGVPVSFDLNHRSKLWSADAAAEAYNRMLPLADLVFAGDDEAAIAVGRADDPSELAHRLVEAGAGEAIVKLGAEGALALVEGRVQRRAAVRVPVVDTVGAGDAFVAGYLAEWLRGADPDERLATAVATGAAACTVPGDWEGAPTRVELARLARTEAVER